MGVEGWGGRFACGGSEARVVRGDHVLAEVDADEVRRVGREDRCDGAGAAGVVEDADLMGVIAVVGGGGGGAFFSGVGGGDGLFEGSGGVEERDAEPGEVLEEEGVGLVDHVFLPGFGGVC